MSIKTKLNAADVVAALRWLHKPVFNGKTPNWVFFEELGTHSSFNHQRIDAWAMNCWESQREIVAYEIKVSRSDFKHELAQPEKRREALRFSNRLYFAAPKGLIQPSEIPPECGLIEVADGARR